MNCHICGNDTENHSLVLMIDNRGYIFCKRCNSVFTKLNKRLLDENKKLKSEIKEADEILVRALLLLGGKTRIE